MSYTGTVRGHDGQGRAIWKLEPVEDSEVSNEEGKTYRMWLFTYTLVASGLKLKTHRHHWDHAPVEEMLGSLISWASRRVDGATVPPGVPV